MTFFWPDMLWAYLLVPILIAAYLLLCWKRKRMALHYSNLSIVRQALAKESRLKRHLPSVLFLLSMLFLLTGVARPAAVITLPSEHKTIVLAIDVSGSMQARDVKPSRIEAAQAAAKEFVNAQPSHTQIGVVAFAGIATLVQTPTSNRQDVLAAIDRLELQPATAIGSGILACLGAIFPDQRFDLVSEDPRRDARESYPGASSLDVTKPSMKNEVPEPVRPGSNTSAVIVLLTDGESNVGPDPIEAARMSAERGIRIFTVGIGTAEGEIIHVGGWSIHVSLDEEALKTIAGLTDGDYYNARSAADLKGIYHSLSARFTLEKKETEITALFAGIAGALAVLSCGLSLLWYGRVL